MFMGLRGKRRFGHFRNLRVYRVIGGSWIGGNINNNHPSSGELSRVKPNQVRVGIRVRIGVMIMNRHICVRIRVIMLTH